MTFIQKKSVMQNEFNPVLQLKAQKIYENEINQDTVETNHGFSSPDSLSPVKVKGSQELVELTVVSKQRTCLAKERKLMEAEDSRECITEKVSPWGSLAKAKITYNPEDYPALSARNSIEDAKFSKPAILKMSAKDKDDFAKDIAKNLTSFYELASNSLQTCTQYA